MRSTLSPFIDTLLERQNADGGWGHRPALPSNSECTALACMAVSASAGAGDRRLSAAYRMALAWLLARQEPNGAWYFDASGGKASWPTPLVLLALQQARTDAEALERGFAWLLDQRGQHIPWRQRLRDFLRGEQLIELDSTLDGWPWTPGAFAWVEPTGWALAALKAVWPRRAPRLVRRRIREGERMLVDRACITGGWNYGNSRVLGVSLDPYPDTTAVALIGLRGAGTEAVERGFRALHELLGLHASGLSLALGAISMRAWGRNAATLQARLNGVARADHAPDHRTLALTVLALAPRLDWLGAPLDA